MEEDVTHWQEIRFGKHYLSGNKLKMFGPVLGFG